MIVINDARASETFVEVGRTATNETGPDHQDGTTVMVKIRQLSRWCTDKSSHRCCVRQLSTTLVKVSWTCTMAVRVWRRSWHL